MTDKSKKLIFFVLLMVLLIKAGPVFAQEIIYPNIPGVQEPQEFLETAPSEDILGLWVKYLVALAVWSSGIIALLSLIWAGITLLISTGQPDKIIEARKRILGSFLGIAVILSAYFVLEIMSPLFLDFTIPDIEELRNIPDLPESVYKQQVSSLDVYVPIGRVIETIFETYISDPDTPRDTPTRFLRIENNLFATEQLLPDILELSSEITDLSRDCSCFDYTDPDPRCERSGCGTCFPRFCTSDPCEEVREEIIEKELEIQPWLFGDIEGIIQQDIYGNMAIITTNLTKELAKTEEEIRLLKYWFDKLGRAEEFLRECDHLSINNRNRYFSKKDEFDSKGKEWFIEGINFFDDVSPTFNRPLGSLNLQQRWFPSPIDPVKLAIDESIIYCAAGGSYISPPIDFDEELIEEEEFLKEEEEKAFENLFHYEKTCDISIPYGEVLDKSLRMTRLLINQLEIIADREKDILESIEELQVLVSHCSSRLCFPLCICVNPTAGPQYCVEVGCFGPACPDGLIRSEMRKIQRSVAEIDTAINGEVGLAGDPPAPTAGIRVMFNELTPDLLEGMERTLRTHMEQCFYERPGGTNIDFLTCRSAEGATDEIGQMIKDCCPGTDKNWIDTEYGQCLNRCYLQRIIAGSAGGYLGFRYSAYSACLEDCLVRQGRELGDEDIFYCGHILNFHCCYLEKTE